MEHIEDKALSSFPSPPTFWKRYVDDVCTAVNHAEIIPFLQHLNSIHPSIQFTHERENDKQCLPFLDVLLERCDDGSLSTSVYRKSTHTGRYLDFASHHPPMHKKAVVKTLFSRAKSLSSCAKLHEECCHITEVLSANHYPRKFIDRAYRAHPRPKPSDDSSFKKTVLIPYIGGLSEAIQHFLAEVDIRVVFRPLSTLRQQLVHPKDDTPTTKKSNVVYSIPCTTCPAVYIGQTSRTLNTRINEHKAAVKHARTEVSAVAEHVWQEKHQMDFQKTCILAHEPNLHQHCFLESWHIQKQHTINREIGSLAPVYSSLF